ncbi:DUF262 domain-containing protein [Psychromonas sp. Urea-02u-13]|uniref:DUF262 domain-containing protein n=1 Tax=Psychromonas sp. Urea-02u-13 TaxID=2058326 RepID=UPI000C3277EF|nr:DUF262 domain-containing protein [Psychromonas sp. Urea-02u-13]PKG37170.1 hypothetical protein CXF74_20270 [Psychromonas sp. Urea-02u-13]
MNITELNKQLSKCKTDQEKITIKAKIKSLVNEAETRIRIKSNEFQYQVREWSIELILMKFISIDNQDENELFIPDYQRQYKWDQKKSSRFIESILLGYPIPYLYIGETDASEEDDSLDGDYALEVIDGSQRLRALYYFFHNEVSLKHLKEITELDGFYFRDLPSGRRRRFLRETMRLVEIKGQVTEDHRRDLFERMNSGSKALESMEIRHGGQDAKSSFYKDVILPCSLDPIFAELAPLSAKKRLNADHREFVLRFFAYANNMENYKGKVKEFLDEYLHNEASRLDECPVDQYISEFNKAMLFIKKHIPMGFRKTDTSKTTPRARYEALAIGTALALRESEDLEPASDISDWLFEDKFQEIVGADSANNENQLKRRINYVKSMLLNGEDYE